MSIPHWPRLATYFLGCGLYRISGLRLFEEMAIPFRSLTIVASVRGNSGLTFLHEVYLRDAYRFEIAEKDPTVRHVFDIGANCGLFALHHARRHPSWRFWCVEPHPETFLRLQKNIAVNNLSDRVFPLHAAAGSALGTCEIELTEGNSMASVSRAPGSTATRTVPITTVDAISVTNGITPDYLKIDVEGFELEVLKGASSSLNTARYVGLEYHSDKMLRECTELLERQGFQIAHRAELLLCSRS